MNELEQEEYRRKWAKMTYRERERCLNRANAEYERRMQDDFTTHQRSQKNEQN
jgi:hypothetical protein